MLVNNIKHLLNAYNVFYRVNPSPFSGLVELEILSKKPVAFENGSNGYKVEITLAIDEDEETYGFDVTVNDETIKNNDIEYFTLDDGDLAPIDDLLELAVVNTLNEFTTYNV